MKQTKSLNSRRSFLKTSALGLGALGASSLASAEMLASASAAPEANTKQPTSEIAVWFTNAKQRFTAGSPISWQPASNTTSPDSIRLVAANKFQDILGFGGCFSDAACYVINQLASSLSRPVAARNVSSFGDGAQRQSDMHWSCRLCCDALQLRRRRC